MVPSSSGKTRFAGTARYCEYMAPPIIPTVRPINACAPGSLPAATTTPAPSLPTGSEAPTRVFTAPMSLSGIVAVITGRSSVPDACAVRHVGNTEQQTEVRRIDRSSLDAHQNLVVFGFGSRNVLEGTVGAFLPRARWNEVGGRGLDRVAAMSRLLVSNIDVAVVLRARGHYVDSGETTEGRPSGRPFTSAANSSGLSAYCLARTIFGHTPLF